MKKITIAIVGTGTVGGGVIDVLQKENARLRKNGVAVTIKTICTKDKAKAIDVSLPKGVALTDDVTTIYKDPEIDMVVELISNVKVAGEIIVESLKHGKHVVTANKAALDKNYKKIEKVMEKNPGLRVGIEAAVAGGIPVIAPIAEHLVSDPIERIAGILNGTTNFILTKMEAEGLDYKEVLGEAQALGYAEADPRADVEGHDARAKLSLLMQLGYGVHPHTSIHTQGISSISEADFQYADMLGSTIRCLGVSTRIGNKVSGFVSPCLVSRDSNFAAIIGATNAVSIDSQYLQNTFLVGQGAGRYPTAVSVVSDIVRVAKDSSYSIAADHVQVPKFTDVYSGNFYIRLIVEDSLGIVERVGQLCKKHKVSIDAVLQLPVGSGKALPFVVTTNDCSSAAIEALLVDLKKCIFVKKAPFVMPIIK